MRSGIEHKRTDGGGEGRAGQGRAGQQLLHLSAVQENFANLVGKSIVCCRNWPAANDCSQVGAGKEVWRLITFNVITLDS